MPDREWDWSLDGRERDGDGKQPMRRCDECGAMYGATLSECPECGAAAPRSAKDLHEEQVRLEKIRRTEAETKAARARIELLAKEKKAPSGWVDKVLNMMLAR